ncbi:MAG: LPS export ABC transporter periplasmic protein LptC [Alcanivoracaceae bacterium]
MKRQGLLSLTGIILLSLIVMMTLHEWDDVVTGPASDTQEALPTLKLTGIQGRHFDEAGRSDVTLDADAVTWQEDGEQAEIRGPRLSVTLASGDWLITAERGSMVQLDGAVALQGNVRATQDGPGAITLESDALNYSSDDETVRSPGPVILRHQQAVTRAGALRADMRTNVLTFTDGVETEYARP